jgi:hypothetical protein
MKKLLLTLTLVAAVVSAYGQGSINFSGSVLNKLSTQYTDGTGLGQVATTVGLMNYGVFYAAGATLPSTLPFFTGLLGVNSSTALGMIASSADRKTLLANVPLGAETSPGEADIWLQVGAWSASFGTDWAAAKTAFQAGQNGVAFGLSVPVNLNALGNPTISGAAMWEGATGTNAKLVNAFVIPVAIPEPTSFALAGLGAAALLIFRRRK